MVGRGLVYNDYSPFVESKFSSSNAWPLSVELKLLGLSPSDSFAPSSTLLGNAELSIEHPVLGRFSLFVANLWDEDSTLSSGLQQAISAASNAQGGSAGSIIAGRSRLFNRLTTFNSESNVKWLGSSDYKTWSNGNELWFDGVLSSGTSRVHMDTRKFLTALRRINRDRNLEIEEDVYLDLELEGFAAQTGGTVYLTEGWSLSFFLLAMSGDNGLEGLSDYFETGRHNDPVIERLSPFLSLVPYLGHTNIFFNGGLDQSFSNREASVAGLAGRGVGAAGFTMAGPVWGKLSYQAGPSLRNAMYLGPHNIGDSYGVEIDNALNYAISETTSLDIQFDLFKTGTFFPEQTWNTQTTFQISYSPYGQL